MITKHTFVSLLDVGEILPFAPREIDTIKERIDEQKRQKEELERFVKALQHRFGEKIYHLGSEIIEGKTYQEFMFHGSGFLEVSQLAPVVINAHFHDKLRARKFDAALKSSLRQIVKPSRELELLLQSVDIKDEHDPGIQFQQWESMKQVRGLLKKSVALVFVSVFVFAIFEAGEELFGEALGRVLDLEHGYNQLASLMTVAIAVGIGMRPLEHAIDRVVSKFLLKRN